jgi:hypothetical protein
MTEIIPSVIPDRNYVISHTFEASNTDMDAGSVGDISLPISLSAAIISAASQEDSRASSCGQAALCRIPSVDSRTTKETTADVMNPLQNVSGHLNFPASAVNAAGRKYYLPQ